MQLNLPVGNHANNVGLEVIRKYAPSIYLNAYDNNHPATVESFFAQSKLFGPNGNVISATVTPEILAANTFEGNYLGPADGVFPSSSNDFESGMSIVSVGSDAGQCNAPVYVKVIDNGSSIDLKYYTFYTWNGFQGFQVETPSGDEAGIYLFNWACFASHYGDWEHVTVRISEDATKLLGVYYSEHGAAIWVSNPSLDGTHPIVYSAWNSHANYPTSGVNVNVTILGASKDIPVSNLTVVDVTTDSGDFETYSKPKPFFSKGVQWKPWQDINQLVLLDNNATASQWLSFKGPWGPTVNNTIDKPPVLPGGASEVLYGMAQKAKASGTLDKQVVGNGPFGPEAAGWNVYNEQPF